MLASLVSFCLLSIALVRGQGVVDNVGTLTLTNGQVIQDGFPRSAIMVNGANPGPLIRGNKGEDFELNVVNDLTDTTMLRPTSVHWHGLFQRGTNWADGVDGVTQCPIAPGRSFNYRFQGASQAGTFWYHSHFGTQYCDGLRGPFVIYDPNDPHRGEYEVDDENTVITVGDWYHSPTNTIPAPALSNATVINGKGRYPNGPAAPLAIVNVVKGRKYRMRLVSISCDPNYQFSIDGHKLKVIEVDGESTQPLVVDRIQILAGQRYSFVLDANQDIGNYWIRALPNIGFGSLPSGFTGGINSAILRYANATDDEPNTSPEANPIDLRETDLVPLENPAAPGPATPGAADVNLRFQIQFAGGRFLINGTAFTPPDTPTLLQILQGETDPRQLLPLGSVYSLPRNQVVELVIPGGGVAAPHPFHLHGHVFSVIRSAGSSSYNFTHAVRRDVVSMGNAGDEVTIRFVTDNPGPWIFHCHIDFHLVAGLAIVFAEDIPATPTVNAPPPEWSELCDAESLDGTGVTRRSEGLSVGSARFRRNA